MGRLREDLVSNELLTRLAQLDSCAISDAVDALGISSVALELRPLTERKRIVGSAVTVLLGADDGRPKTRHLGTAAVEASGPGKVIVVAHGARTDVAGWGGILSLGAVIRGVEGVVIDGACRDVDEAFDLGLPIYGRAAVPVTARGRVVEYGWNVPVEVAGVDVEAGDFVIADSSGVVFFPQARAEEVIAVAEAVARRERAMAEDVRKGKALSEVMGKDYDSMIATVWNARA